MCAFSFTQLKHFPLLCQSPKETSFTLTPFKDVSQIKGLNFPFHATLCNMHGACGRGLFSLSQQFCQSGSHHSQLTWAHSHQHSNSCQERNFPFYREHFVHNAFCPDSFFCDYELGDCCVCCRVKHQHLGGAEDGYFYPLALDSC